MIFQSYVVGIQTPLGQPRHNSIFKEYQIQDISGDDVLIVSAWVIRNLS